MSKFLPPMSMTFETTLNPGLVRDAAYVVIDVQAPGVIVGSHIVAVTQMTELPSWRTLTVNAFIPLDNLIRIWVINQVYIGPSITPNPAIFQFVVAPPSNLVIATTASVL